MLQAFDDTYNTVQSEGGRAILVLAVFAHGYDDGDEIPANSLFAAHISQSLQELTSSHAHVSLHQWCDKVQAKCGHEECHIDANLEMSKVILESALPREPSACGGIGICAPEVCAQCLLQHCIRAGVRQSQIAVLFCNHCGSVIGTSCSANFWHLDIRPLRGSYPRVCLSHL